MGVTELKSTLAKLIGKENDLEILEAVYAILNREERDRHLRNEMNAGADESEADIEAGRVYTLEEVRAHFEKKFSK